MEGVPGHEQGAAPDRLGRFELRGELGAGGMGVVFEAWDSQLRRKVAVKLLHADDGADPDEARERLLREAQAMARVAHQNVIAIHEVGEWEGRVFIVMELVERAAEAGTLWTWLSARPRTWREVRAIFEQAGRGLAAAHARGLVHRDFKPDNVLVDADGRARVTDFGMVGVIASGDVHGPGVDDVDRRLTRTGRLVGTPRYMAPEQHEAGPVDARTDQFAFCVSLWHALFGAWPFAGERYSELADNVTSGKMHEPPRGHGVPAWLERAVRRGLSADPAARWPSMDDLLAAMTPPRPRRRAIGAAIGGLVVVAAGAVAVGSAMKKPDARPAPSGANVARPAAAPAKPVVTPLPAMGGCSFSPLFIDADTVLFDLTRDEKVDFFTVRATGLEAPVRRTDTPLIEGFASIGRRPGEALYAALTADGSAPPSVMALDLATWASEKVPVPGFTPPAVVGDALYYPRADLKELRRLRDGVDEPFFTLPAGYALELLASSPDGRWLAMTTGSSQSKRRLCLIDLAAATPALDCPDGAVAPEGRPVFTPDSKGALYVSQEGSIRRFDVATREDRVAVPGVVADGGLTLAPDGRSLVFSDCRATTELTDVTARPPKVFAAGRIGVPEASADGRLVWVGGADGNELILRELDGTQRIVVPATLGPPVQPSFDPTGRRIVFRVRGEQGGIYLADVTPYPPERLTTDPNDFMPRFLDEGRIVFTRPVDGQNHVYLMETTPGTERRAHPGSRYVADVFPSRTTVLLLSPDRRHVYEWDPATGKERELQLPAAIREGKNELRGVRASADDRAVYLQLGFQGGELWRVPVDGGAAEVVWDAPDSVTVGPPVSLPDGRVLAPAEVWRGELHRVELGGG